MCVQPKEVIPTCGHNVYHIEDQNNWEHDIVMYEVECDCVMSNGQQLVTMMMSRLRD